jgi:hypothetical protein
MACQGGHILATIDSGFSWIDQYVNTMLPLNAVSFADSLSGWVVGDSGVVLRTRDGGAHWQVEPSGTGSDLYTVCFRDTMNGWAAGSDGAIIHYAPSAGVEEYRAPKWTSSVLAVHPDRTVFRGVLRFRVSGPPEVDLKVRNSAGQTVWNRRISGNCEFQWDGRDKNGRDLPPGVYFLVARDQSACATARVTLVR